MNSDSSKTRIVIYLERAGAVDRFEAYAENDDYLYGDIILLESRYKYLRMDDIEEEMEELRKDTNTLVAMASKMKVPHRAHGLVTDFVAILSVDQEEGTCLLGTPTASSIILEKASIFTILEYNPELKIDVRKDTEAYMEYEQFESLLEATSLFGGRNYTSVYEHLNKTNGKLELLDLAFPEHCYQIDMRRYSYISVRALQRLRNFNGELIFNFDMVDKVLADTTYLKASDEIIYCPSVNITIGEYEDKLTSIKEYGLTRSDMYLVLDEDTFWLYALNLPVRARHKVNIDRVPCYIEGQPGKFYGFQISRGDTSIIGEIEWHDSRCQELYELCVELFYAYGHKMDFSDLKDRITQYARVLLPEFREELLAKDRNNLNTKR